MRLSPSFALFVFSLNSGVPFLLTLSTLSFWLAEAHVSPQAIGLMMVASLPYSLKFLWAPWIDLVLPLGKRCEGLKAWMVIALIGEVVCMVLLSLSDPLQSFLKTLGFATMLSVFASTHDMVVDRLRMALKMNLGGACAIESVGFRIGMMVSGAGALYLASLFSWKVAYAIMTCFPCLSLCLVPWVSWPSSSAEKETYLGALSHVWHFPLVTLGLLFSFKGIDSILHAMSAPFFISLGLSKMDYANISKVLGTVFMIIGGAGGGFFIHRLGITASVTIALILQSLASLSFMSLLLGHDLIVWVIGFESFVSGLSGTVFLAYVSSLCKAPFLAAHFTLLYSLGSLGRVLFSGVSGWIVSTFGWSVLFLSSGLLVIPQLMAVCKERLSQALKENLKKRKKKPKPEEPQENPEVKKPEVQIPKS